MGSGYFKVRLSTGEEALPIEGAQVSIFDSNGMLVDTLHTDESGLTPEIELDAPPAETQFDPYLTVKPYSTYSVKISAVGYNKVLIKGIQIFDKSSSVLPYDLVRGNKEETYDIGINGIELGREERHQEAAPPITARIHREVFIPTHITVHLGRPGSNARNITVPFAYYIKNVASSEIFPDWPYHSLRANIHAIISLALNRVFTEWYRGKGYNFDITNSTQYDQYFVENRNIFDSISVIVDEIFNTYIIRPPGIEPYYAEYCDGFSVTCPGMKQWGTVTLANQGMNYLQILRYYYGQSIFIQSTDNIRSPFESFRGNLALGSSGEDVAMIQMQLARIRRNYPLIPNLSVDGTYGSQTVAAVRQFQEIFGLGKTGTVDRRTWYQISNIYSAVMRLAELGSEGHRPPEIDSTTPTDTTNPVYPGTPLKVGSQGENVRIMQQFLNEIGKTYTAIPSLVVDGVFGNNTRNAVIAFQQIFGLTQDGIIGPVTWRTIVTERNKLVSTPVYPGTPLRVGSSGAAVATVQNRLNRAAQTNTSIPTVVEDGIFGPATQASVIAFQRSRGVTADGIVGPVTWNLLMQV